jgi:hypothetical protein
MNAALQNKFEAAKLTKRNKINSALQNKLSVAK